MIDIYFITGYSTVKIERVSDWYWFYYNFREIEQKNLHILLFYIKFVSVFWEKVVSAHGSATALKREFLGFFLFLFVYINLMSSCSWRSQIIFVWAHIVSAHVEATTLNRESLGIFFVSLCLYYYLSSCSWKS